MKTAVQKILCLLIVVALVISPILRLGVRATAAQNRVGDVNADNQINVGDVARLYAHFQGKSLVGQDAMIRADLDDCGWLYPSYVQKLYDRTRDFTLGRLIAAVSLLPEGTIHADRVTVQGRVIAVDSAYNPEYKNISVVLRVSDTNEQLLCYRMTGPGVASICVGDDLIVTGFLRNYRGRVEFAAGCECTISRGISTAEDYNKFQEELIRYLPKGVSPRTVS